MHASRVTAVVVLLAAAAATVVGAWPPDPAVNVAVADRPDEQIEARIIAGADGSCCIGWFDKASGNYDLYLQLLDRFGNEVGPHNGLLVSAHVQDSWLCGWDMLADSSGNALFAFTDLRAGGDRDVYIYLISPAGQPLWGPDGIAVTDTTTPEFDPYVVETSEGNFVVVWDGDAGVGIQEYSIHGIPRFGPSGLLIEGELGEQPGLAQVVPADDGSFIVSWMRHVGYPCTMHIRAQKFAADGTELWPAPVVVYDGDAIPRWHQATLIADGAGGAIVGWPRSVNNLFNIEVQHIDADGNELFAHNGVTVCEQGDRNHMDPDFLYEQSTGQIAVFWSEKNGGQTQYGIYGQRLGPDGRRQWGDTGAELAAVDAVEKSAPRGVLSGDGAMVFWIDRPGTADRVVGVLADAKGGLAWPDSPRVFSSADSGKARLLAAPTPGGRAVLAWEDDRSGDTDLYAQNANLNGTLGLIGDLNCDGEPNFGDINPFVLALTDPAGYTAAFPDCEIMLSDINCDGRVDFGDINPFVALLTGR